MSIKNKPLFIQEIAVYLSAELTLQNSDNPYNSYKKISDKRILFNMSFLPSTKYSIGCTMNTFNVFPTDLYFIPPALTSATHRDIH